MAPSLAHSRRGETPDRQRETEERHETRQEREEHERIPHADHLRPVSITGCMIVNSRASLSILRTGCTLYSACNACSRLAPISTPSVTGRTIAVTRASFGKHTVDHRTTECKREMQENGSGARSSTRLPRFFLGTLEAPASSPIRPDQHPSAPFRSAYPLGRQAHAAPSAHDRGAAQQAGTPSAWPAGSQLPQPRRPGADRPTRASTRGGGAPPFRGELEAMGPPVRVRVCDMEARLARGVPRARAGDHALGISKSTMYG